MYDHIGLEVKDVGASARFYQAALAPLGHVLASRRLRTHTSLTGRLTALAWKGRDAVSDGAARVKKTLGGPQKSGA